MKYNYTKGFNFNSIACESKREKSEVWLYGTEIYGKRGTGTRKMGWVKKIAKKCNRKKGLKHKAGKKKSVCSVCIYWDKSEA